ncbi:hypothetical protein FLA105534_04931 [Flavobacterium bizetiae]|uniref:Uncharacterized protein n=1 Tax=Flavobacterium bizetiae TaxID=2704140 RepID=A0A6J4GWT6_9FLAO|nr:hypothetical protein FLA105534_04931 [Flavobacterium bizetiae]CAD5343031.1 hypothetical protein FLA105535_03029 [Flavobacterium bizetiae]CAD5350438.1 hypothetical protein FLA105534_04428 [Flavobacterium bizetiae]
MIFCRHELCHFKIKNAFNFFLSALNYAFSLTIKTVRIDNQIVYFVIAKIIIVALFKDVLILFLEKCADFKNFNNSISKKNAQSQDICVFFQLNIIP